MEHQPERALIHFSESFFATLQNISRDGAPAREDIDTKFHFFSYFPLLPRRNEAPAREGIDTLNCPATSTHLPLVEMKH